MPTQRGKLADRDSIPGYDERLALVELAHNVAAVIAQFPLGDLFGHTTTVARVLRRLTARAILPNLPPLPVDQPSSGVLRQAAATCPTG